MWMRFTSVFIIRRKNITPQAFSRPEDPQINTFSGGSVASHSRVVYADVRALPFPTGPTPASAKSATKKTTAPGGRTQTIRTSPSRGTSSGASGSGVSKAKCVWRQALVCLLARSLPCLRKQFYFFFFWETKQKRKPSLDADVILLFLSMVHFLLLATLLESGLPLGPSGSLGSAVLGTRKHRREQQSFSCRLMGWRRSGTFILVNCVTLRSCASSLKLKQSRW